MEYIRDMSSQHPQSKPMVVSVSESSASASSSARSPASSTRGGSSLDSVRRADAPERQRSSVERAMGKAKSRLSRRPSGAEALPDDEEDFERQKAKAIEKQRRKEEY